MLELRKNQLEAIKTSLENDFESGIHYHATGTGKSIIGYELLINYHKKYKTNNIIWLCEQKNILNEQFSKEKLSSLNYSNIFKIFNVLNYTNNKNQDWYQSVNSINFWTKKPTLLIINRAFLVSSLKYKKLKLKFDLIIHDECHTITNSTTQDFYNWILDKMPKLKCIGLTATPNLKYKPFTKLLTNYSIFKGVVDQVILPPKIVWVKSESIITQIDILKLFNHLKKELYYKKVIVWCGMVDLCISMSSIWQEYLQNDKFKICIDISDQYLLEKHKLLSTNKNTNKNTNTRQNKYISYQEFQDLESYGILFCAAKHREGSDIKNLDCAIFLDKVENRNHKTFVQCLGRVLRIDKNHKKKKGLIIDVKAKNCISVCDRMNEYLQFKGDFYPWNYKYYFTDINNKRFQINTLDLLLNNKLKTNTSRTDNLINLNNLNNNQEEYQLDQIKKYFIREIPDKEVYQVRLEIEYKMINSKKLFNYLFRAIRILELAGNIPHVTRGSCGSSLICYLMGISHVDPVKYNIKFSRFLNEYRNTLPDVDFDFPHNLRDDIFLKLELNWPGKVARISNHIHYHEKSAVREAFRKIGINKFIGKDDIYNEKRKLSIQKRRELNQITKELENQFRCYSLHCGGIVFFPDGIPNDIVLEARKHNLLNQIVYDKNVISENKQFKIDILSSRALSQLFKTVDYENIDFETIENCPKTIKLLKNGHNIGLTLAESSLIRKEMIKLKPKTVKDMAIILAIIRPAAKEARENTLLDNYSDTNNIIDNKIIFDDDVIELISKTLKCDEGLADKYRRGFTKGNKEIIQEMRHKFYRGLELDETKNNFNDFVEFKKRLENSKKYSFCKAHAYSYAQLIWKLAYMKANKPKEFWRSTLLYCKSSYRKWVHLYEALLEGVDHRQINFKKHDISIYSENKKKKFTSLKPIEQLKRFGYWDFQNIDFFPGCYLNKETHKSNTYSFNGIIASNRILSYSYKNPVSIYYIGVRPKKYIEIIVLSKPSHKHNNYYKGAVGISGIGTISQNNFVSHKMLVLETTDFRFF